MDSKLRVGYYGEAYPTKRMIIGKWGGDPDYIQLNRYLDFGYVLPKIGIKVFKSNKSVKKQYMRKKFYVHSLKNSKCDVVHSFNLVLNTKDRWLVSYENLFPNLDGYVDKAAYISHVGNLTSRDNCLGIFPLSQWAKDYTEKIWCNYMSKSLLEKCLPKLEVLQPPQKLLVDEQEAISRYNSIDEFQFVFIGNDFWRKGGHDLVKVLKEFERKGKKFHLHVISALRTVDSTVWHTHQEDVQKMADILMKSKWITWHREIPNEQVLEIVKKSHVGFLPTYEDTYGFCVLEIQACGVPVVTTNSNALSEFNDNNCGWIIDMDGYLDTRVVDFWNEEDKISRHVNKGLELAIEEIFNADEDTLKTKSRNSMESIRNNHSIDKYGEKMIGLLNR